VINTEINPSFYFKQQNPAIR